MTENETKFVTVLVVALVVAAFLLFFAMTSTEEPKITPDEAVNIARQQLTAKELTQMGTGDLASLPPCSEGAYPCKSAELVHIRTGKAWQVTFVCGPVCAHGFWIDAQTGEVLPLRSVA